MRGMRGGRTLRVAGRVNLSSSSISSSAFPSSPSSTETYTGRLRCNASIFAGSRESVAENSSFWHYSLLVSSRL